MDASARQPPETKTAAPAGRRRSRRALARG
jgi:hypothetical protein